MPAPQPFTVTVDEERTTSPWDYQTLEALVKLRGYITVAKVL